MKHNSVNKFWRRALVIPAVALVSMFSACSDDDPKKENTPELITEVTLTFTPVGGGSVVEAIATDKDGEGVQELTVDGPIDLEAGATYTLTIELINGLVDPTEDEYDITAEVREEGHEHMFFFGWTNNVFSDPAGNGNIDTRADDVNYTDEDDNELPIGLRTRWTAAESSASGTFRVMLKHQPKKKTATSTSATGESDIDLTFTVNVD